MHLFQSNSPRADAASLPIFLRRCVPVIATPSHHCSRVRVLPPNPARGTRMKKILSALILGIAVSLGVVLTRSTIVAAADNKLIEGELLHTGMKITPTAAPGSVFQRLNPGLAGLPEFTAGQAVSTALSPDG